MAGFAAAFASLRHTCQKRDGEKPFAIIIHFEMQYATPNSGMKPYLMKNKSMHVGLARRRHTKIRLPLKCEAHEKAQLRNNTV
jgi:hypothetical protein